MGLHTMESVVAARCASHSRQDARVPVVVRDIPCK